jgi:RNA polymerase sigma-70 factor (ECF subfamily)
LDEPEFEALYRATVGALRLYVYRACGDWQAAEELTQEAFFRLLRSPRSPRPLVAGGNREETVRYLYRIASNLTKERWRHRQRLAVVPLAAAAESPAASPAGAAGSPAVGGELAALELSAALGRLGRRDRELLWLAYAEGYTHAEIASILGLGAASVRVLLFRARHRILRLLRPPPAPGRPRAEGVSAPTNVRRRRS